MRLRKAATVASVMAACGLLAGCLGSSGTGLSERLFGASSNPTPGPNAAPPEYFQAVAICPAVEIRSGTESLRVYERGAEENPQAVRFQASISETARDCHNVANGVSVKVGVSGRVIAGPKGGAGNVSVPVRIAVLKDSTEVVYSKLHQVSVTLAAPTFGENFSFVDDQVIIANVDPAASYRVYVGFDERGT